MERRYSALEGKAICSTGFDKDEKVRSAFHCNLRSTSSLKPVVNKQEELIDMVLSMSGHFEEDFTPSCNFLVAKTARSPKYQVSSLASFMHNAAHMLTLPVIFCFRRQCDGKYPLSLFRGCTKLGRQEAWQMCLCIPFSHSQVSWCPSRAYRGVSALCQNPLTASANLRSRSPPKAARVS